MTQTAPKRRAEVTAREIRRQRLMRLGLRLVLWVVAPTLLASVYYGLIASQQYESVALVAVHSTRGAASIEPLAAILPSASSSRDGLVAREYVLSRSMLNELAEENGFVAHYQSPGADFLSRLDDDASNEDLYEYYLSKVDASHDAQSGTLTLRVRAFTAEDARAFAGSIIASAENMVNKLSDRERRDRTRLAEQEVARAEARLAEAQKQLLEVQGEGRDLDPTRSAEAVIAVRAQLDGELARLKAELDAARAVMHENAPKVVELRQKVAALRRQITRQGERLVTGDGEDMTKTIAKFEPAVWEKELAQQVLAAARQSLELARVEASRQQRYLVTIAEPSLPDVATHPRRLWRVATVAATALALMIIFTLLGAAVREHAKL